MYSLILILCLSLEGQFPAADFYLNRMSYNEKFADWGFAEAQEDFVIDSIYPHSMCEYIPPKVMQEFNKINNPYYKVREKHRKALEEMPEISRWLFWGRRYERQEGINSRQLWLSCGVLLEKLSMCRDCGGKGEGEVSFYSIPCVKCNGRKYFWEFD